MLSINAIIGSGFPRDVKSNTLVNSDKDREGLRSFNLSRREAMLTGERLQGA